MSHEVSASPAQGRPAQISVAKWMTQLWLSLHVFSNLVSRSIGISCTNIIQRLHWLVTHVISFVVSFIVSFIAVCNNVAMLSSCDIIIVVYYIKCVPQRWWRLQYIYSGVYNCDTTIMVYKNDVICHTIIVVYNKNDVIREAVIALCNKGDIIYYSIQN